MTTPNEMRPVSTNNDDDFDGGSDDGVDDEAEDIELENYSRMLNTFAFCFCLN